jgi:hypothetical protein
LLGMMGKYHTYSSPQRENMRHSILPHYVTQARNTGHTCTLVNCPTQQMLHFRKYSRWCFKMQKSFKLWVRF